MSIKSIKIKNLLSFDDLTIKDFKDINCIVGINNSGKSNLLKLIRFFYDKLDGKRVLPPILNSNYSSFGTITIIYDTSRIKKIVTSKTNKDKSSFFKHINKILFKNNDKKKDSTCELTLKINSDDSIQWSIKNKEVLNIINYLYPFFEIETRHIDLYDWNKLWFIVSRLKSFNINKLEQDKIVEFFNDKLNGYQEYVKTIEDITQTGKYHYRERVLNYVKAGLKGQTFLINEQSLEIQSDGTNSHRFIEIALELLISLTRKEYINPTIYIDEPEIGLHPKRNEELIYKLYNTYTSFKKTKKETKEKGKYKTPYPKIIFATHSPNIVKEVIKLFEDNQQILHFSKKDKDNTKVQKMNSTYKDKRFLNIFSDNEARLFFSNFILFVEGETELEIFRNKKLLEKFPVLKKIDVYKSSSNVLGSYINPSYSNTSIPYLFLFDADKIYSFKTESTNSKIRKLFLENKNKNLYILPDGKAEHGTVINDLINKYKKGFNKKYKDKLANIQKIKTIHNKKFTFDKFNFKIEEREEFENNIKELQKYLSNYDVRFIHTTIEEVLINLNSKNIFFKWLYSKHSIDKNDYTMRRFEKKYNRFIYKYRLDIGNVYLYRPRKIVTFSMLYNRSRKFISDDILIDYFRLLFGGKMEILVPYKHIINDSNRHQSKKLLKYINNKLNKQDKTSGWATSFLNFAIEEIENSLSESDQDKREKEFRDKFKQNFGELYDIITHIETNVKSDR